MSFPLENIKLDKTRKIKFTIGKQMQIEMEFNAGKPTEERKDIFLISNSIYGIDSLMKVLAIGLSTKEEPLTAEDVTELVDNHYEGSLKDLDDLIHKALGKAVYGEKAWEDLERQAKEVEKNALRLVQELENLDQEIEEKFPETNSLTGNT